MKPFNTRNFHSGTEYKLYDLLGAHTCEENGAAGTRFAVWAPHARSAAVITSANSWDPADGEMGLLEPGIWETFIPGASAGDAYRFVITAADGRKLEKSDPMAFASEKRPANASLIHRSDISGDPVGDQSICSREKVLSEPMAIYEVHLGSWKKDYRLNPDGFLNYRDLAHELRDYISFMGYTHVELIGICEYPFDPSWGYQVTGFYAPTSRYGSPEDFRYFVDTMHSAGIGVILDWVPAHFPKDSYGLAEFDGEPLYESADPLRAEYPEWGTKAFDHGRPEVKSFLISSALFWLNEYGIDALRVDAVAAMLYNSFGRSQWRPNKFGGDENLESTEFLRELNLAVKDHSNGYLIAEDSSIQSGITAETEEGGLGFKFKWNLGWMNDTLRYMEIDPIFRKWEHEKLVHISEYAFLENYILVLSHDEVVHLKHSMLEKLPGSEGDRLAGLKALYSYQFTLPGKKLLFMGQDFGEELEWDENRCLDWGFAHDFGHRDVLQCVRNLLALYRSHPVLFSDSKDNRTFEWIKRDDAERNIVSFIRRNPWNYDGAVLVVCNFSPVQYPEYSCGTPVPGMYPRVFSSYDSLPGAGGPDERGARPTLVTDERQCDCHPYALSYALRPYECIVLDFPS